MKIFGFGTHQAIEAVHQITRNAGARVPDGYAEVEDMVQQRAAISLAVCFGAGVMHGGHRDLAFTMALNAKRRE